MKTKQMNKQVLRHFEKIDYIKQSRGSVWENDLGKSQVCVGCHLSIALDLWDWLQLDRLVKTYDYISYDNMQEDGFIERRQKNQREKYVYVKKVYKKIIEHPFFPVDRNPCNVEEVQEFYEVQAILKGGWAEMIKQFLPLRGAV